MYIPQCACFRNISLWHESECDEIDRDRRRLRRDRSDAQRKPDAKKTDVSHVILAYRVVFFTIEKAAPLVRASLFRRPADNATRVRKAYGKTRVPRFTG